jgi:hypothetical protein
MASKLARTVPSAWKYILKREFNVCDSYLNDDPDLDFVFRRLAHCVCLTYTSDRTTKFCLFKSNEAWPQPSTAVLCEYEQMRTTLQT